MMVRMEQAGLSQELKRLAADTEDIRALGQSTHIDGLTIKMGQIDAAASIQVKITACVTASPMPLTKIRPSL